MDQVSKTLDDVEDQLSGIPKKSPPPPPNMPDGRMYPPLPDRIKTMPDGTLVARTRGHIIEAGPDGSLKIINVKTGEVELQKRGGR